MSGSGSLIPAEVSAPTRSLGKLPFAFGPRFFVALLLGLLWVVPAWWWPRLIAALFLWDLLAVAAFVYDLLQLPKPSEIQSRRVWQAAPSLSIPSNVTLIVESFSKATVRCLLIDETPASLRSHPPVAEVIAGASASGRTTYGIVPRERGDARVGRLFLRYQSRLGFAQRWSAAEIAQTVRVLPDIEQARQHALYLIRSKQVEMEKRRRRQRGQGREFQSLRDYRQGDDLRDICWTATGRRHVLTTRVFEIE